MNWNTIGPEGWKVADDPKDGMIREEDDSVQREAGFCSQRGKIRLEETMH